MTAPCPFCRLPRDRVLHERETAFAVRDGFPVSAGHTLIAWSYGHAERVQAEVWLGGTEYGHLSAGWRGLLG